jgi:hypothetical protein
MNYQLAVDTLDKQGYTYGKPKGNSMSPRVKSGEKLLFLARPSYSVGDVVLCKVHGTFYVHMITKKDPKKGYLITNHKGFVNGWTKNVYGKAHRAV